MITSVGLEARRPAAREKGGVAVEVVGAGKEAGKKQVGMVGRSVGKDLDHPVMGEGHALLRR